MHATKTLFSRQRLVWVGMSGGVDSSVAAYLLHQNPEYKVEGVYMQNWNTADEVGQVTCPHDAEYEDVKNVCTHIGIPFRKVNIILFIKTIYKNCTLSS